MQNDRNKQVETREAVGIVISDGGRGDVTSRLAAFVWGPVPDDIEREFTREQALLVAMA
jgi:hypothetical protein